MFSTTPRLAARHLVHLAALFVLVLHPKVAAGAETCTARTGSDATLILPAAILSAGLGQQAGTLRVYSDRGDCHGETTWDGTSSVGFTIWGDDPMTEAVDGFLTNDALHVRFTPSTGGRTQHLFTSYDLPSAFEEGGIYIAETVAKGMNLAVRVFLQGAYDRSTGLMRTTLADGGWLPTSHPYAADPFVGKPAFFEAPLDVDPTTVGPNSGIVDYVVVEARPEGSQTAAARAVGLLTDNGYVLSEDGTNPVQLPVDPSGSYRIVIRHRSHLDAVSSAPAIVTDGYLLYNFTSSASTAGGFEALVDLGDGRFGLYAGDASGDGQVNTIDKNLHWWRTAGLAGYHHGDFDLNGQVNTIDKNLYWWRNAGKGSFAD